ncbi:hypothetical protein ACIPSJ_27515 [Streptomyces sp. NPDC090088]
MMLTALGGAVQGVLGALVCLAGSVLVAGALLMTLQHSTPGAPRSGRD